MKIQCDNCDQSATIHLTEITDGHKVERHLCQACAEAEGITVKSNIPITQLLEDFILQAEPDEPETDVSELEDLAPAASADLSCDICGMKLSEFRSEGRLGCPNDYDAFEPQLLTMLQRAHQGADQHLGKVPHRADESQKTQNALLRLRAELKQAVACEDYERAAAIRDQIREMEQQ